METEKEKPIRESVTAYGAQTLEQTPVVIALTLDQLLTAIRQLDDSARMQVIRVLLETQSNTESGLDRLIRHIVEREPADDISDEEIAAEIRAVRLSHRQK